jgi:hypothetical protein
MVPLERLEEKRATNPPSLHADYRCFLHRQEPGGQDRAFQFRDGLANYKVHCDLSWFKVLLGGNSPTSSGMILKMNRGYNGVSRKLNKLTR